jgi:hypothetical protein
VTWHAVDENAQQAPRRALDVHQIEAQAGDGALDAGLRADAMAHARRGWPRRVMLAARRAGIPASFRANTCLRRL